MPTCMGSLGEADWANVQAKLLPGFAHVKWRNVQHRQPARALSPVFHHSLLPLAIWVLRIRKQRSKEDIVMVVLVDVKATMEVEVEMEVKLVIEMEVVGRNGD